MSRFAVLVGVAAAAPEFHLTPENFDELTAGKTVFLKMYAPWCGHCKKMAPDWLKLEKEYEGHATAGIFEVDCTAEGKPICDANGVQGFPTIKYGDPSALEDYKGGRSYDDFKKFADENLKPTCSPTNIELCDEEKTAQIKALQEMEAELLEEEIKKKEAEMEAAETEFKDLVTKLQKKYEKANKAKDATIKEIKDSGLGLMKSVKAFMAKSAGAKTEL